MNYINVMKKVNELDTGWNDDFRFAVEVAVDYNFDENSEMTIDEFVNLCVNIANEDA